MSREALPPERLTPNAIGRRRNARAREAYGLDWPLLCALVAIIARHRCGLTTARRDLGGALAEYEVDYLQGFDPLVRRRLVRVVSRYKNVCVVEPTSTAVAKFAGYGREPVAGAAE